MTDATARIHRGLCAAARAQQPNLPVVGLVSLGSADTATSGLAAFRKGLSGTGHVEGRKVTVEYQ